VNNRFNEVLAVPNEEIGSKRATFFVSHAWIHHLYHTHLTEWAGSYLGPLVEDLSISLNTAIPVLERVSEYSEVRQKELAKRLGSVQSRLRELTDLKTNLRSLPEMEFLVESTDEIWRERNPGFGMRRIELERKWLREKRDRLLLLADQLPGKTMDEKVASAETQHAELEQEQLALGKERESRRELSDLAYKLRKYSLGFPAEVIREVDLSLADEIEIRIVRSDMIFVIAETWSQYRSWLSYELERAVSYKKPIIAITLPGETIVPPRVQRLASACAEWSKQSVHKAIRKLGWVQGGST
jgi:hypothetical protein